MIVTIWLFAVVWALSVLLMAIVLRKTNNVRLVPLEPWKRNIALALGPVAVVIAFLTLIVILIEALWQSLRDYANGI